MTGKATKVRKTAKILTICQNFEKKTLTCSYKKANQYDNFKQFHFFQEPVEQLWVKPDDTSITSNLTIVFASKLLPITTADIRQDSEICGKEKLLKKPNAYQPLKNSRTSKCKRSSDKSIKFFFSFSSYLQITSQMKH